MRKQMTLIFKKNRKRAPTDNQVVKMATKRWSQMSEEQKQIYKRLSKPIEEPQGISLPKTVKCLLVDDPNLPQGWSRNLQQRFNQNNKSYDVGVCVVTADKVRLFNTEGVKKYLAKHPYTDIDPDSISFNPYKQNDSQEPALSEASNRGMGSQMKQEQAEDPLALDEGIKNAEDSGQNLDLFSSVSSLEQIYGNID